MIFFCDYFLSELEEKFKKNGLEPYRARQVATWVYKKGEIDLNRMTDLSPALRQKLIALPLVPCSMRLIEKKQSEKEKATKYLFQLQDGKLIETVLLSALTRKTLCLSTQVGCPVGCQFCASGKEGVERNLDAHEIVEQVVRVNADLLPAARIQNIVVMGMGEPFLNYTHLMKALRILNAPWGPEIGARHITVSTAGIVPGIQKFAQEKEQFRLSISLHAATDEKRTRLMPINKTYPLPVLRKAVEEYVRNKERVLTFEYILLAGINDTREDAQALKKFIGDHPVKINLIPYNPTAGVLFKTPTPEAQQSFLTQLKDLNIHATLREEKGSDIDAACGQLRLRKLRSS